MPALREGGQVLPERIRLIAVPGQGSMILYRVFVEPDADFDTLRPTFDRIRKSLTAEMNARLWTET